MVSRWSCLLSYNSFLTHFLSVSVHTFSNATFTTKEGSSQARRTSGKTIVLSRTSRHKASAVRSRGSPALARAVRLKTLTANAVLSSRCTPLRSPADKEIACAFAKSFPREVFWPPLLSFLSWALPASLSRASPSRSGLGRFTSLRLWSSFCLFPTNRRASQFTTNDDRQLSSVNFLVPLEIGLFLSYLRLVSRVLGQDWDTTRDPPCDLLPLGEKERGARNLNKGATFYEDRPSQRRKQGCK